MQGLSQGDRWGACHGASGGSLPNLAFPYGARSNGTRRPGARAGARPGLTRAGRWDLEVGP